MPTWAISIDFVKLARQQPRDPIAEAVLPREPGRRTPFGFQFAVVERFLGRRQGHRIAVRDPRISEGVLSCECFFRW